eukprot:c5090_g1_i1.p1 GENE.c5090_g1_i1~~c5090_g1_i1.p1  ORF type:complete len:290 (+),score=49.93 c5090_g1_i1:69-938(+)
MSTAVPKHSTSKSTWSAEEDTLLFEIVQSHGAKNWPQIAQFLPGRSGKQCRERFKNHLDPTLKKEPFSPEEDMKIIRLVEQHGQKWAYLALMMKGRTDNAIKNRYNSSLRRAHEEGRFADLKSVPSTPPDSPSLSNLEPDSATTTPNTTPGSTPMSTPQSSPTFSRRTPLKPVYLKRKPSLSSAVVEGDTCHVDKAPASASRASCDLLTDLASQLKIATPRSRASSRRIKQLKPTIAPPPQSILATATSDPETWSLEDDCSMLSAAVALCALKCNETPSTPPTVNKSVL